MLSGIVSGWLGACLYCGRHGGWECIAGHDAAWHCTQTKIQFTFDILLSYIYIMKQKIIAEQRYSAPGAAILGRSQSQAQPLIPREIQKDLTHPNPQTVATSNNSSFFILCIYFTPRVSTHRKNESCCTIYTIASRSAVSQKENNEAGSTYQLQLSAVTHSSFIYEQDHLSSNDVTNSLFLTIRPLTERIALFETRLSEELSSIIKV